MTATFTFKLSVILKVPTTPKNFFRFVKSLHGTELGKNAAKVFAID